MTAVTIHVIVIPLKGNGNVVSVCLALRIMHATTIKLATMKFPLLILLIFRLYLQKMLVDSLMD